MRDLLQQAASRSGVMLNGDAGDVATDCVATSVAHALSLVIDVAAGIQRTRTLELGVATTDGAIELAFGNKSAPPNNASELLAIAAAAFARDGGSLHCSADRIVVHLPIAAA